jgi:hypothetical protein
MGVYASSLSSFTKVLGSKDFKVLKAASARLTEIFSDEAARTRALAWLRTLVQDGFPLKRDREPVSEPADGGLLTMRMETEAHLPVVYCIVEAISTDGLTNLGEKGWGHPAVSSLFNELRACGFTDSMPFLRSREFITNYYRWMHMLSNGTPLFGDDFRSSWSYYTWFTNKELANIIPVFRAAAKFRRPPLSSNMPNRLKRKMMMHLSKGGKEFIGDLIKWFGQIQKARKDAFIYWS